MARCSGRCPLWLALCGREARSRAALRISVGIAAFDTGTDVPGFFTSAGYSVACGTGLITNRPCRQTARLADVISSVLHAGLRETYDTERRC